MDLFINANDRSDFFYLNEDTAGGRYAWHVAPLDPVIHNGQQQTEHLMDDFRLLGYIDAGLQTEHPRDFVEGRAGGARQDQRQGDAYVERGKDRVVAAHRSTFGIVNRSVQIQGKPHDPLGYDVVHLESMSIDDSRIRSETSKLCFGKAPYDMINLKPSEVSIRSPFTILICLLVHALLTFLSSKILRYSRFYNIRSLDLAHFVCVGADR